MCVSVMNLHKEAVEAYRPTGKLKSLALNAAGAVGEEGLGDRCIIWYAPSVPIERGDVYCNT